MAANGEHHRATVWLDASLVVGWYVDEVRLGHNRPAPEWLRERLAPWVEQLNSRQSELQVEPLQRPRPEPQVCLPLRWSASPLDVPAAVEAAGATERPIDLGYEDHWLVAG